VYCDFTQALVWLVQLYTILLLVYAVLSWIPELRMSAIERFLAMLVEPLLAPIRRIVPPMGGLDIAFLILILVLQFLVRPLLGNLVISACAPLY
jgi:YggT family protein